MYYLNTTYPHLLIIINNICFFIYIICDVVSEPLAENEKKKDP